MPRFAANLTMMYPDLPFLERFEAAARDGFKAVEYLFPYAHPAAELAARLKGHGLQQVHRRGRPARHVDAAALGNVPDGLVGREATGGSATARRREVRLQVGAGRVERHDPGSTICDVGRPRRQ